MREALPERGFTVCATEVLASLDRARTFEVVGQWVDKSISLDLDDFVQCDSGR